jgi:hypothetical protein
MAIGIWIKYEELGPFKMHDICHAERSNVDILGNVPAYQRLGNDFSKIQAGGINAGIKKGNYRILGVYIDMRYDVYGVSKIFCLIKQ